MSVPPDVWNALQRITALVGVAYNGIRSDPTAYDLSEARQILTDYLHQQRESGDRQFQASLGQIASILGLPQAVVEQALATDFQSIQEQVDETTGVSASISADLKSFTKPSVFGQIVATGGLLTGNDAMAHIKRLADHDGEITRSLGEVGDSVYLENSRGDKFPGHVHSFVLSMIEKYQTESTPHYFFVFNQSTTWHPKFDDIKRAKPLGDRFLGYSHDLDELVAFIVEVARPRLGPEPVIHILMPTINQLAITEPLTFPVEMGPFRVTGQLGEHGLPFVYLLTPLGQDQRNLCYIGTLKPKPSWVLQQQVGVCLPVLNRWLATSLKPMHFEDPYVKMSMRGLLGFYSAKYFQVETAPPRTLGIPRGS